MTPTKLLIGQIFIVFAIVVASMWAGTQWAAAQLAYQPALGRPWFALLGTPIYRPWSIFPWWFSFDAYAPTIFDKAGAIAAMGGFLGCGAAVFGSVWRARQSSNVTTYGSARWATPQDIAKAGLLGTRGVAIGRVGNQYLRHDGPEHVMAFAPTRSGKGVGLVVPTLLSWTGSVIVHDIKGENWALTAGWRSRFSHCLLFNPTDARSARYNPLLEVRRGPDEVRDVQNIADILVDPEGALERRSHWEKTSHALLVGAILHVLYAEEEKTLARVATFLSDPQRPFTATLRRMMTTNHLGSDEAPAVHPVVASAARELLNKSENERSGVLSTAMSFLGLYRDPTVAAVTSASDWRIADLAEALAAFAGKGSTCPAPEDRAQGRRRHRAIGSCDRGGGLNRVPAAKTRIESTGRSRLRRQSSLPRKASGNAANSAAEPCGARFMVPASPAPRRRGRMPLVLTPLLSPDYRLRETVRG